MKKKGVLRVVVVPLAGVAVNIVLEQLVDQLYVGKDHAPAAVPLKMELVHSIFGRVVQVE